MSSVIKSYQSSPVLGGSVVPQTLLCSDGLMAGSSVGGSCGYHKVLRTKPQSQRKRIQTQRIFEAEKPRIESLSEYDSKTGITFVLALRPIGAVAWGSPSQFTTIGYELRLIRDTRERYRSPTSLKIFSSWGATRHDRASSAAVEHPPRLFMT